MVPAQSEPFDTFGCGFVRLNDRDEVITANATVGGWLRQTPHTLQDLLTSGSALYWQTIGHALVQAKGSAHDLALELRGPDGPFPTLAFATRKGLETHILLVPYSERARFHEAVRNADVQRAKDKSEIERLAEAEMLQSRFINAIAHQVATPMTPVWLTLGTLEQLAKHHPETAILKPLAGLRKGLERLDAFHKSLVDAARVQAGRVARGNDVVHIAGEVQSVMKGLSHGDFELNGNEVTIQCVRGDVHTVIHHVLDNAARYGASDRPIEVTVSDATLVVRDHGPGIPEELARQSRKPFVKSSPVEESTSVGAGLGLYVVDGLMRLHGGQFALRRHPDGGTEARLSFARGSG